ncbi:MAG TPA: thioredoxin family protein [Smithella sp.]|jgi:small redox-active disulfide protein 2|nr:thioredoxin family protein [Smithella sp.]HQP41607.1 thioredoxin family protein [Smithella sp.]
MKIEILGTGCAKCQKLEAMIREAVSASGIEAEISKVNDIKKIMTYGVLTTPGLVIDGEIKTAGKLPTADQIELWLKG